jgi:fructokinase
MPPPNNSSTAGDEKLRLGAVEAGGTKFLCGVGSAAGSLATATIPTRDPETTLAEVEAFFATHGSIDALGIGSFGPLDLETASPTFGHILRTPKPGWSGVDLRGRLAATLGVPAAIDTDVNAAALAEAEQAAVGTGTLAYVTVGTGIGVGIVADGKPLHGAGHPEAGHLLPRRHPAHGGFAGVCSFHGDCLEGLASGPAIVAAWGSPASELAEDHIFWEVEAGYLAQLCAALFLTIAPHRIVLGGGVMDNRRLLPAVRVATQALLGGYIAALAEPGALERRIVAPACAEPAGLVGAYLLAARALGRG